MTERAAILLVFFVALAVVTAAFMGLKALHAANGAFVVLYMVVLTASSLSVSRVVMHYGDKSPSDHDRR